MAGRIDPWGAESRLYAYVDANGMRHNSTYKDSIELGSGHFVDVKITNFSKETLSLESLVETESFVIGLNFRKNEQVWLRVDNEGKNKDEPKNYLHFHSTLNGKDFTEHQKIQGKHKVKEIISMTFDSTYTHITKQFPDEEIINTNGFVGTA